MILKLGPKGFFCPGLADGFMRPGIHFFQSFKKQRPLHTATSSGMIARLFFRAEIVRTVYGSNMKKTKEGNDE
jgi:hypothetical protein